MKRILSLITALCLISVCSYGQTAKVDKNGNYVAVQATKKEAKPTGKTFTDSKGVVLPVFASANGKLFVMRKSEKTGKEYKSYLKLEE